MPRRTSAPTNWIDERRMIEMPTPEMDWISVVSAVRRDRTSPIFVTSKNAGSIRMTCR